MVEKQANIGESSKFRYKLTKYTIFLSGIFGLALIVRLYYFPFEVPLNSDALYYFWYSSDILQIGALPSDWSPTNNGWPIFVSLFFSIFADRDIQELMSIQRLLSVIISISISIPAYFLCKKFVDKKFAIIGAVLIAFEPRLMINSFLGATDPLYLLLIASSLTFFLSSNKKFVYVSFVIVGLATLIRGEGVVFFIVLSILFFIKNRDKKYKTFLKYILIVGIFLLVLAPLIIYRIETTGGDGIFMRGGSSAEQLFSTEKNIGNEENSLSFGFELLIKYLVWIMIPNFIIFIPLGIFLIFQKRTFENLSIIISVGLMSIPALYAYSVPAPDTRYLYVLLPMFSVLSVLAIQKICGKIPKSDIVIIVIVSAIIVSSILFYDYKKIDYEHEKESFEVMKKISPMIKISNSLYPETSYFNTIQTVEQWPNLYSKMEFDMSTISTNNHNSMEEFVINSQDQGLTHIIVDDNVNRDKFLRELFIDEAKHSYLKKIYDSKDDGFNYHVKVFEIDYNVLE